MTDFSKIPWIASHTELYKTDPDKAHMWDASEAGGAGILPTLLLTTKGRKSGESRDSPLLYATAGVEEESYESASSFVIIASKGGWPTHPHWFLNLEAEPECRLQIGRRKVRARARVAEGAERERLWKRMAALYPPYDDYQAHAGERRIPVVVLDVVG